MRSFLHFFLTPFLLVHLGCAKTQATDVRLFDAETLKGRVTALYETYASLIPAAPTYQKSTLETFCDQNFKMTLNGSVIVEGLDAYHAYIQAFQHAVKAIVFMPFEVLSVDTGEGCVSFMHNVTITKQDNTCETRRVAAFLHFDDAYKVKTFNEVVYISPMCASSQ